MTDLYKTIWWYYSESANICDLQQRLYIWYFDIYGIILCICVHIYVYIDVHRVNEREDKVTCTETVMKTVIFQYSVGIWYIGVMYVYEYIY